MLGLKLARHGKRTPGNSEKHTHFRPQKTPSDILVLDFGLSSGLQAIIGTYT
jgi:hypothetical protein